MMVSPFFEVQISCQQTHKQALSQSSPHFVLSETQNSVIYNYVSMFCVIIIAKKKILAKKKSKLHMYTSLEQ